MVKLRPLTTLFTNMQILKFKSQLTTAFFAAVNHLNGPLRKQDSTLMGSKGQDLWFVIGGFWSVLCVSVFQGSLLVVIIMIDGSEKRNCEGGFWTLEVKFYEKYNNEYQFHLHLICNLHVCVHFYKALRQFCLQHLTSWASFILINISCASGSLFLSGCLMRRQKLVT